MDKKLVTRLKKQKEKEKVRAVLIALVTGFALGFFAQALIISIIIL